MTAGSKAFHASRNFNQRIAARISVPVKNVSLDVFLVMYFIGGFVAANVRGGVEILRVHDVEGSPL